MRIYAAQTSYKSLANRVDAVRRRIPLPNTEFSCPVRAPSVAHVLEGVDLGFCATLNTGLRDLLLRGLRIGLESCALAITFGLWY